MSSSNTVMNANPPGAAGNRSDKNAVGGAAGVEIVGFPQVLYTRTFGDPDLLFVPLLDAARDACEMIGRLVGRGENRASAVQLSGMHLASSLLRDSSFSLVARGLSHENVYRVDLEAGTLHANTRLFAVVSRRTSFFKVEIASKISSGPFVVRNPVQGTVIMQVEEARLRQPNFFSASLASECLRSQMEQERFARIEEAPSLQAHAEARLVLSIAGNKVPVTLRQTEEGGKWDILNGRKQEWVGSLSSAMEGHLRDLTAYIQELFEQK